MVITVSRRCCPGRRPVPCRSASVPFQSRDAARDRSGRSRGTSVRYGASTSTSITITATSIISSTITTITTTTRLTSSAPLFRTLSFFFLYLSFPISRELQGRISSSSSSSSSLSLIPVSVPQHGALFSLSLFSRRFSSPDFFCSSVYRCFSSRLSSSSSRSFRSSRVNLVATTLFDRGPSSGPPGLSRSHRIDEQRVPFPLSLPPFFTVSLSLVVRSRNRRATRGYSPEGRRGRSATRPVKDIRSLARARTPANPRR